MPYNFLIQWHNPDETLIGSAYHHPKASLHMRMYEVIDAIIDTSTNTGKASVTITIEHKPDDTKPPQSG